MEMRRLYKAHMKTKTAQEGLAIAIEVAKASPSCLICFEHDQHVCHRSIAADMMAEKAGFTVRHLAPQPEALP
jgi:hypothetical protein